MDNTSLELTILVGLSQRPRPLTGTKHLILSNFQSSFITNSLAKCFELYNCTTL